MVHAPDTSILLSNAAAAALLGFTEDQMLGKTAMDPGWGFLQENGVRMPLEDYPVNRVIASGERLLNHVVGVHRAGHPEPVWLRCTAYPISDEAGQLLPGRGDLHRHHRKPRG
ncbi:MAG: PAS domain-containing protein [Sulfuritalea sp.]|nr:PAS domain-containing protein [Sulfuritalea sp.]